MLDRKKNKLVSFAYKELTSALYGEASLTEKTSSKPTQSGLVYVFTGDGKGKTSGALGVVLRALGHGLKAYVIFFMKGDYPYGERRILSQLPNVDYISFGSTDFVDPNNVKPQAKQQANQALEHARDIINNGEYDVVVLDEVNVASAWGLVKAGEVIKLVKDKPERVELILTGRGASTELMEIADLVTECLKIKHPFDRGILARKGIDW
jgi:cob(I)alamin adenosyltransferase